MYRHAIVLLLSFVLLNGCVTNPSVSTTDAVSSTAGNVSFQSYPEFSQALANALHNGDKSLFVQSLDMERFLHRSFDGTGLSDAEFRAIMAKSQQIAHRFVESIDREVGENGQVEFVRMRPQADSVLPGSRSLIRIVPADGGVAYWDFYLDKQDGRVVIYDWFNYGTGQLASTSIGGYMKLFQSIKDENKPRLLKLVRQYAVTARKQQYERALKLYAKLPQHIQRDPLILVSRVQMSMAHTDEAYRSALADLARYHGDDDRFALLLVDYYLYSRQYPQGHRALDMVTKRTGGDAGLEALHAALALEAGNYQDAVRYARTGIGMDPDYEQNYWVLLQALAQAGHYDDTVLVLKILQEGFLYEFDADELATADGFQQFGQSHAFATWRASLQ